MNFYYRLKNKFRSYSTAKENVPSMEAKRELMSQIKDKYNPQIFVETGTLMGDTIEYFKNSFKKLYSIELAEDLAKRAQVKFEMDRNITIINGDSGDILQKLVNEIDEPALIWLDGHYSSEFFVGKEYIKTAKGKKETPVEEELKALLASKIRHIILIDDARHFIGLNDYPSIGRIKRLVKRHTSNYSVSVVHDIIHILPDKK